MTIDDDDDDDDEEEEDDDSTMLINSMLPTSHETKEQKHTETS